MWFKAFVILSVMLSHSIIAEDINEDCTPNSSISDGICTLIGDCPPAVKAIQEKRRHPFERCGFDGYDEIVCCPRTPERSDGIVDIDSGATEVPRITKRIVERECEKIKEESIRKVITYIIGGVEAELGEFPHMVALAFDRGNGYEFDCGGSLLSKNYVLTAAHCIDTLDGIEPSVARAGVIDVGGNTWNEQTDYQIVEIITHPNYTRREKYHDLALLRLKKDVTITDNLYPICIETGELAPNSPLTITGWGKTSVTRNTKSNILLKAVVTPVASDKCSTYYSNWRKLPQGISADQLCAGDPAGLKDTCQGDSGGPLQLSSKDNLYSLVGVTSFGRGCGSPIPGVYTRVANYVDWIESIVWSN